MFSFLFSICFSSGWAQEDQPIDIIVISDLNGSYGSTSYSKETHNTTSYILQQKPDLVLVTGDMVAGQKENLPYVEMWEGFHQAVTIPLEQHGIPLAVSPGNHDASGYKVYQEERDIFVNQWLPHKPEVTYVDDSGFPLYYAFTMRDILFVSLDNTTLGGLSRQQKKWLDKILNHPASHKVVYGHIPLFPFAEGREKESLMDFELENILIKHGVDLFLSGHHHAYYPGYYNTIRYVSVPCLGAGARFLKGSEERSEKGLVHIKFHRDTISVEGKSAYKRFSIIPKSTLPSFIEYEDILIWRDDLFMEVLTDKRD